MGEELQVLTLSISDHVVSSRVSAPAFAFSLRSSTCNAEWCSGSKATSPVYGQQDTSKYRQAILKLAPGETITTAILYGDGNGAWLGHIHIETSLGQTFEAGRDTSDIRPYGIDVGSGILLGAVITPHQSDESGAEDIASLGFLFLGQHIDHISISNVTFKSDPAGTNSGINPQQIVVGQWYNHAPGQGGYSLSPTRAVVSSYS